jgi:hypothetical protein
MTRRMLKTLLALVAVVLMFGAGAEAAGPKKVVRHRPKHSSRVASGQTSAARKKVVIKRRRPTTSSSASASKSKTTVKKPVVKRKPTKPR